MIVAKGHVMQKVNVAWTEHVVMLVKNHSGIPIMMRSFVVQRELIAMDWTRIVA